MKKTASLWLFVFLVLVWGGSWPINKVGLSFTSPSNYMELRFLFGTLVIFLIAWIGRHLIIPNLRDLPIIVTGGLFQMAVMMNLANYGLSFLQAGQATFLVFTVSVWIIPLAAFLNRRISFFEGVSFFVGLLGISCLVRLWNIEDENVWKGSMLLLLSAFSWAIGILCSRHMKWHRPPLQLVPWQLFLATLCTLGVARFQGIPLLPNSADPIFLGSLFYTGALSVGIGYWVLILVSRRLSPAITAFGLLFIPIVALCISMLFMDEQLSLNVAGGVILLTLASLIHIYAERNNPKEI